jgi:hypothetical protein
MSTTKVKIGDIVNRLEGNQRVFVGNVKDVVRKLKDQNEVHSVTTTAKVSVIMRNNLIQSSLVVVNTPKGWKSFFNPGYSRNTLFEIVSS